MFLREDFLAEDKRYLIKYLNKHYDYCYLDAMHKQQANDKPKVIITGSSHGLDAINAEKLSCKTINLSMHTQDLYYDYQNLVRAIKNNASIEVCVATFGYYNLHYDLSKTSYNYRCYEVYEPMFDDVHNARIGGKSDGFKPPIKAEEEFYLSYFKEYPSYYGPAVLREHTNGEIRKMGGWSNLTLQDRENIAKERAFKHNKHTKYIATFKENKKILADYASLCDKNGIRLIVAIMPFSKEYLKYIDKNYRNILISELDNLSYSVEFVDFNDIDCYETDDFIDSDHCSDSGARKLTMLLEQLI